MNHYPLWRYLLIAMIIGFGALYAAPNLYGTDPSLQISARRSAPVDESLKSQVEDALKSAGVTPIRAELAVNHMLLRFADVSARTKASSVLKKTLDAKKFILALKRAPRTPDWLLALGESRCTWGSISEAESIF